MYNIAGKIKFMTNYEFDLDWTISNSCFPFFGGPRLRLVINKGISDLNRIAWILIEMRKYV